MKNHSLNPNPNSNPNSNSNVIINSIPDTLSESERASRPVLASNLLRESEVIACEIATLHLDLLFMCLHGFQLGTVSRTLLIEQLGSHASAVDEVREILLKEQVGLEIMENEIGLSEKVSIAS